MGGELVRVEPVISAMLRPLVVVVDEWKHEIAINRCGSRLLGFVHRRLTAAAA